MLKAGFWILSPRFHSPSNGYADVNNKHLTGYRLSIKNDFGSATRASPHGTTEQSATNLGKGNYGTG
jgi:hypothetical protein